MLCHDHDYSCSTGILRQEKEVMEENQDTNTSPPPNNSPVAVAADEEVSLETVEVIQQPSRSGIKRDGSSTTVFDQSEANEHVPKRSNNAEAPLESLIVHLEKICESVQIITGQTMTEIAELFLRNEPALASTVEHLRLSMAPHSGQLGPSLESFRVTLGAPRSRQTLAEAVFDLATPSPSTPQEGALGSSPNPTRSAQLTESKLKDILSYLGRVLELSATIMKRLGFGDTNTQSSSNEWDDNRIAYVITQSLNQLSDVLQYNYRRRLSTVVKNVGNLVPRLKERVESSIGKAKEVLAAETPADLDGPPDIPKVVQVSPVTIYPGMEEPQYRYKVTIPRDDFGSYPPQLTEPTTTSSGAAGSSLSVDKFEENFLTRFGAVELINGSRVTKASYSSFNGEFSIYQMFNSKGWVDPKLEDAVGEYVRVLEVHLNKYKEGSFQHQIKVKPREQTSPEGHVQHIEVAFSGIPKETAPASASGRVQFDIALPAHLMMMNVNDVGIRNGLLKIQFSK